jgi:hypothetical protein
MCSLDSALRLYFVLTIAALTISEVLIVITIILGSRGTIMNERPRRNVAHILLVRVAARLFELGASVYASTFVFAPVYIDSYLPCEAALQMPFIAARISVVLDFLLVFGVCIELAVLFDPLGRTRVRHADDSVYLLERAHKLYRRRYVSYAIYVHNYTVRMLWAVSLHYT